MGDTLPLDALKIFSAVIFDGQTCPFLSRLIISRETPERMAKSASVSRFSERKSESFIEGLCIPCTVHVKHMIDNAERLRCYDAQDATPVAKLSGDWGYSEVVDNLDKSKMATVAVTSSEARAGQSYKAKETAELLVRCRRGKTSVLIVFDSPVAFRSVNVNYRVGASPARQAKWDGSESGKAYGIFDGPSAVALAKSIEASDDFYVEAASQIHGTSGALFKTVGAKEAFAPIRSACKW